MPLLLQFSIALFTGMVAATFVPPIRRSIPRPVEVLLWVALITACAIGLSSVTSENARNLTTSVVWASDNKTLFYTTEDPVSKRSDKFWRHVVGSVDSDPLFDEQDELFGAVYVGGEGGDAAGADQRVAPAHGVLDVDGV